MRYIPLILLLLAGCGVTAVTESPDGIARRCEKSCQDKFNSRIAHYEKLCANKDFRKMSGCLYRYVSGDDLLMKSKEYRRPMSIYLPALNIGKTMSEGTAALNFILAHGLMVQVMKEQPYVFGQRDEFDAREEFGARLDQHERTCEDKDIVKVTDCLIPSLLEDDFLFSRYLEATALYMGQMIVLHGMLQNDKQLKNKLNSGYRGRFLIFVASGEARSIAFKQAKKGARKSLKLRELARLALETRQAYFKRFAPKPPAPQVAKEQTRKQQSASFLQTLGAGLTGFARGWKEHAPPPSARAPSPHKTMTCTHYGSFSTCR